MMAEFFVYTQHISLSFFNVLVSLVILYIVFRRQQDIRGSGLLMVLMIVLSIRAIVIVPMFANMNVDNLLFWHNVQWPINHVLAVIWVLYSLLYTRVIQQVTWRHLLGAMVIPIVVTLLIIFDHELKLIREGFDIGMQQGLPLLQPIKGILHVPFVLYLYGMAVIGTLFILHYALASPHHNRRIISIITLLICIVLFINTIEINAHPIIVSQIIIFIIQTVILIGMIRDGFLQYSPYDRPLLMLVMQDAYLLFDHFNRVTDLNETAAKLLGQSIQGVLGLSVDDALASYPEIWDFVKRNDEDIREMQLHHDEETYYYQVSLFQIQASGDISRGIVFRDITAEKQAQEVRFQNLANQARMDALAQFITNASHDLKHPLTNIGVRLYLLEKTLDNDRQKQHVESIRLQTEKLQQILDDMFLLMQLSASKPRPMHPVHLSELLEQIKQLYEYRFVDKGIEWDMDETSQQIVGDFQLLITLFTQLLNNALMYTDEGGRIAIRVHDKQDTIQIDVSDTGVGIMPDQLQHVTESFFRGDSSRNVDTGGSGLGLTLVKEIVRLHHATVTIDSEVNQGTTVTLAFPTLQ